jgi:hypothetical protein
VAYGQAYRELKDQMNGKRSKKLLMTSLLGSPVGSFQTLSYGGGLCKLLNPVDP